MSTNITHIWIYSWLVATACMAAYFALVIICHESFFIIKYISEILDIQKSKKENLQNEFDPIEDYIRSSKEHSYLLGNQVQ